MATLARFYNAVFRWLGEQQIAVHNYNLDAGGGWSWVEVDTPALSLRQLNELNRRIEDFDAYVDEVSLSIEDDETPAYLCIWIYQNIQ